MKIMIFAAGGDIGGGKTHILSLAQALSRENELRLVCFRKGEMSDEAPLMGIDTVYIDSSEGYPAAIRFALSQYDEFRPQLIHCHGAKANALGIIVKKLRHCPVMTTVHSNPSLDYMGAPLRRCTFGVINAWALKRMDFYSAVAWRMRELLIDRGYDAQKIMTVYNGMDFSDAVREDRPAKAPDDPIVVGIAARLNPVKDIPTLLKAFAIAYRQDPRLRLSVAGTGEEEQKLRALAKELGISDVTTFEGWISDIKTYFKGIDINVLCSLSETFPYSLLEGAYVRCPAIASDVGGIPSLVIDGKTGLMFQPGDCETFASHILKLASDEKLRAELARALQQKAESDFSLERMKNDQQEIYETLVRRYPRQGRGGALLCGAYGKGNAGDEAILTSILSELREIDPDMPLRVMSRSPKQTSKNHSAGSFHIFDVPSFFKALRRSDIFVNGGGSLIQDVTSSRSLWFYLFTLLAARKAGCKVIMYGCGIGPVSGSFNRKLTAKVLNKTADVITVRDSGSLRLLNEIGVTAPEIIRAADPVTGLDPASGEEVERAMLSEGLGTEDHFIAFCLRPWKNFINYEAAAAGCRYAREKYGLVPVFIPIEYPRDVEIGKQIAGLCEGSGCIAFEKKHSVREIVGILSRADAVIGMRLHSLIFAAIANTPAGGISYDIKVESFMQDNGSEPWIDCSDFSEEDVRQLIDRVMSLDRERVAGNRERLRELEKQNRTAAKRLLEEKRGGKIQ